MSLYLLPWAVQQDYYRGSSSPNQAKVKMQSYLFLLSLFSSLVFSAPITTEAPNAEVVRRDLNAILLAIENDLPFISGSVADVCDLITDAENVLSFATDTAITDNGLTGACADMTIIYARGTCDPGNAGFLVGPPFYEAVQSQLGSHSVSFQGVLPYAASVTTFLEGGDPQGIQAMAAQVEQARSQCPSTKLVMAGYSQGCEIVHKAAALLPAATAESLSSIVMFGDPRKYTTLIEN